MFAFGLLLFERIVVASGEGGEEQSKKLNLQANKKQVKKG